MLDVITMGSAVIDLFIDTELHEKKHRIIYDVGSKIAVKEIRWDVGGGGTNTAVALSRLGLKVGFLGKIGKDENGKLICRLLRKEKVKFLGGKGDEKTGCSVILDSKEHNRTILTYKGVNDNLTESDFRVNRLRTRWLYFSSMMGKSFRTQQSIMRHAVKKKIKIAFNPSSYQIEKEKEQVKKMLRKTHLLVLNREEAEMLAKGKDIMRGLYELGPRIVCVTEGKKGNKVYDRRYLYDAKAHADIKAKERTGAGDAFASSFLAGMIRKDVEFGIQLGVANAESVIRYYGAKNKLLRWDEALEVIRKNPVKIKKEKAR